MDASRDIFSGLTDAQRAAVDTFEGPLLVLAGPGSGKTRVITRRIARLIERGVSPRRILAITFTNRAAREMQERVDTLLPESRIWVSTFHRFCASVLRRRANLVGLESNFVIYDKADQLQVVRHVLDELDLDALRVPANKIAMRMSKIKNAFVAPEQFAASLDDSVGEPFDAVVKQVYPRYQQALLQSNAVDFDDLLLHVVRLFHDNPELRADYDERFRFVLVDEYQDTNPAQYAIVRALSVDYPNVCVTGDPDQSIYGWRGAHIDNILNFERDFPGARLVRLEQNFRSTALILKSADQLIAHNRLRKAKSLITDNVDGDPVQLLKFADSHQEADGVAQLMRKLSADGERKWSDCAIFYRVNAMSREFELALTRQHVPFQVAGGVAFYDRTEVKDLLAYLRLIENPADAIAFARIVNKPARGIGAASVTKLQRWANLNKVSLFDAARSATEVEDLSKAAQVKCKAFVRMIESFSLAHSGSVSDLLKHVIERTNYARLCIEHDSEQAIERRANVEELINAAAQYDERAGDERTIGGFLETTALVSDDELVDPTAGKVTLMTLHSAKGLEFPVVFIAGVEHGLIPHERSLKSPDPVQGARQLEEERRLLFVGMTRAMRSLFLTTAAVRDEHGKPRSTILSSFLQETTFETLDMTQPVPTRSSSGPSSDELRRQELKRRLQESAGKPMLMTGAALLAGKLEEAELPTSFAIGAHVRHPRYGRGIVVDVNGFAKRRTVTVEFEGGSLTETFSIAHCPLQPVGGR